MTGQRLVKGPFEEIAKRRVAPHFEKAPQIGGKRRIVGGGDDKFRSTAGLIGVDPCVSSTTLHDISQHLIAVPSLFICSSGEASRLRVNETINCLRPQRKADSFAFHRVA